MTSPMRTPARAAGPFGATETTRAPYVNGRTPDALASELNSRDIAGVNVTIWMPSHACVGCR
eukprot:CAMPEP_0205960712 /NCGR_PEP_ID=MMETSP1459-20131121/62998_1 /ASSEMBLY_ACC=CAM_ASM_001120 /TAXON_ID=41880 /ORGANISM="Pycnococcus provasolii, Strain RCC931" /LENGTH=61 /DNA_ID=CAMNT_0053333395 /DNA_START=138 /DNA_END=319 /DNA_ORIENTATION=-